MGAKVLTISDQELGKKNEQRSSLNQPKIRNFAYKNNDIIDWSASLQSLLDQPPAEMPLRIILSGVVFLLAFLSWAWLGKIEDIGTAKGKLVPKGETYKVESVAIGKVSRIAVKEGETVTAGQVIAELDTSLDKKEVKRLEQMLSSYEQELKQKQSLLNKVYLEAQTHQQISTSENLGQESAIKSAEDRADTLLQLLIQQKQEINAYNARHKRLKLLSNLSRSRVKQLELDLKSNQGRVKKLKSLEKQGAISSELVFQANQNLSQVQSQITESKLQDITSVSQQIFQNEQSMRTLAAKMTEDQGELYSAYRQVEQLKAELNRNKAERTRLKLEAYQKIDQLKLETTQARTKVSETKNQMLKAKATLDQKLFKAPIDGVVLSFNLKNEGKVVNSGQTVAEIAPHNTPLIIAAVLPNQEAGFIKKDQPAKVKFDAYSYQDYGVVPGKVSSISSDSKYDPKLGNVYQVEVELERHHIVDNNKRIKFRPGQSATANIVIRQRRIIDVLLDPIKQLKSGNTKK
ncbi:HlyD family efflux transporter periplasmic adaptor subunit [Acaryochloris sp. CCMEE 5410]|nr:HlyD family efflux transporter periplasmic adaptor subunit [Acaryochloris sp. CCMEE 5410]